MIVSIKSVLGDSRTAAVNIGAGFPWYNCPFCTSPTYTDEAHPDVYNLSSFVGTHGKCSNPWCPANPNMPVDEARLARGKAILDDIAVEERVRNHRLAMGRLADETWTAHRAFVTLLNECRERGACVKCSKRGKFVRHRTPGCPK